MRLERYAIFRFGKRSWRLCRVRDDVRLQAPGFGGKGRRRLRIRLLQPHRLRTCFPVTPAAPRRSSTTFQNLAFGSAVIRATCPPCAPSTIVEFRIESLLSRGELLERGELLRGIRHADREQHDPAVSAGFPSASRGTIRPASASAGVAVRGGRRVPAAGVQAALLALVQAGSQVRQRRQPDGFARRMGLGIRRVLRGRLAGKRRQEREGSTHRA